MPNLLTKLLAALVVVLLVVAIVLGSYARSAWVEGQYLKTENKALVDEQKRAIEREDRDRKVLVARQAKIASKQRELDKAQEALSEALQRNKSWSDTDVPDDVQKALDGRSGPVPDGP